MTQLAVAAAPALEAVANALASVARTTGPVGIAIKTLFDNIGRLTTYAATFGVHFTLFDKCDGARAQLNRMRFAHL